MGLRGPKPTCECGSCPKCLRRARINRYRKKHGYRDPKTTERVRAWRAANRERDNARELARYYALDEEGKRKKRARGALNDAIRSGRMERQPCEVCGAEKAHGHHDDYNKPYDVRWLCAAHHAEVHAT